jgi:hypothetical protein
MLAHEDAEATCLIHGIATLKGNRMRERAPFSH